MNSKQELIEKSKWVFQGLVQNWGFQSAVIREEKGITRILFSHPNDFGFEVELDWRNLAAFGLIVRLENGKLPKGYYISNGRKCRKHLQNIAREQGWEAKVISDAHSHKIPTRESLEGEIATLAQILFEYVEEIVERGVTLLD